MNMLRAMARSLDLEMPFDDLTIGMMKSGAKKPPKLKLKAAEGRYLLPILLELLKNCVESTSAHAVMRLHCVSALNTCYEEMYKWNPSSSPDVLRRYGRQHLIMYMQLSREAQEKQCPTVYWRPYPKHHLFWHCCSDCQINPLTLWCYAFESEIGRAVRIAGRMNAAKLHHNLMRRYITTM